MDGGPAVGAGVMADNDRGERYPALIGCIGQARRGQRTEILRVAARFLIETLAAKGDSSAMPSFALRRRAILTARAALNGSRARRH